MTTANSAYPVPVEKLLPRARQLTAELGQVPSRNRLKAELRIGAPKATALRDELEREHGETTLGVSPDSAELAPASEAMTEPIPVLKHLADEDQQRPGSKPTEDAPLPDSSSSVDAQSTVVPDPEPRVVRVPHAWPLLILALPAFVAIWSGWVGLGELTGFGIVHPLPGIADGFALNTAITLPIGVETYAAYALRVWLSGHVPQRARRFARNSALGSLALGALGQVVYHLMAAAHFTSAPWLITTAVSCLPVAVLGMGAGLAHLLHSSEEVPA